MLRCDHIIPFYATLRSGHRHFLSAPFLLAFLLGTAPGIATAAATLYTNLSTFNSATNFAAEVFITNDENVGKAEDLELQPGVESLGPNTIRIGTEDPDTGQESLTYLREDTGLFYSFRFTATGDVPIITFDDEEGAGNIEAFDNALSPGDIDDGEDDDWRIRLIDPIAPMRAFGFELRDNNGSADEKILLWNAEGNEVGYIDLGNYNLPTGNVFLGVVSDEPFVEIRFDEDAGGDDIAVADFYFVPHQPTAVDVYAATLVNTAQSPQSAIVTLEGSDEAAAPLTYSIVSDVAQGTLRDPNNGDALVTGGAIAGQTLTYTPNVNFTGTDSFTYKVNDGNEDSETRAATLSVFEAYRQQALQIGEDIDGEAAGDESGHSVSLSSDGRTVAIGAIENGDNGERSGHVRIYRWNGASWVQLGDDIDGEAQDDRSGSSVALSSDGNTVAIGAPYNDGYVTNAGHVRIYRWNGASWLQLGADIDGEAVGDRSGWSVSLSSDGSTVAIGAPYNDGNGDDAGRVRIYRWNGATWAQLGSDIDGEAAVDDYSGWSVALSSDGNSVAIGAYGNDGNGIRAGHVRIYRWNGASWVQLGIDIDGEAQDDQSGWSVSLSSDGRTVAIGAYGNDGNGIRAGHVRIYRWSGASWVQLGDDIDGEARNDQSGLSVSLSSDGHTVAIGAPYNDGGSGHVRIYHWNGASWVQLGADIDGEAVLDLSGWSVSLSGDGQSVAIDAIENDGNGDRSGHVRIYDLTLSPEEDDDRDGIINADDQCPATPASDIGTVNNQGCAPTEIDSDNDGVNDALDAFPDDPAETTDTDGDGLGDNREAELGTLPDNPDTDGDGFSDFDEVEAETDPLSASDVPAANGLNIILIKAAMDAASPPSP